MYAIFEMSIPDECCENLARACEMIGITLDEMVEEFVRYTGEHPNETADWFKQHAERLASEQEIRVMTPQFLRG